MHDRSARDGDVDFFERLASEFLRALRGTRSQVAFSRRLGYRSNVAYSWESGRRFPTTPETLRAAARVGVDVRQAFLEFFRFPPAWLAELEPSSEEFVAAAMQEMRNTQSISAFAAEVGVSRFALGRWLRGQATPRLPDFLRVVSAGTDRLIDWLACFVDVAALPSAQDEWKRLRALRALAYAQPFTEALLVAMELESYRALPRYPKGWLAERLGLDPAQEHERLEALKQAGIIRWNGRRWSLERARVDHRGDMAAARALKRAWAKTGLERLEAGSDGLFSYLVFGLSEEELVHARELHLAYYESLRELAARSERPTRTVVANVQLFALDS